MPRRRASRLALATAAALLSISIFAGAAIGAVSWSMESISNTTVAPGATHQYLVQATNTGDMPTNGGEIVFTATLPPHLKALEALSRVRHSGSFEEFETCTAGDGSSPVSGATEVRCANNGSVEQFGGQDSPFDQMLLSAEADPGAPLNAVLTAQFSISGGDPANPTATVVDPTRVAATPPGFGLDALDAQLFDPQGNASTQAAGHPDLASSSFDLNTFPDPLYGPHWPLEPLRDIGVELPPGLLGDPTAAERCTITELSNARGATPQPLCPPASQVGTQFVRINSNGAAAANSLVGPLPLFNMVPPPGVAARFGVSVFGSLIILDATVRNGRDYGVTVTSRNTPEALTVIGATTDFWGVPASPAHDSLRACSGRDNPVDGGTPCPSPPGGPRPAFLRNSTACTAAGVGFPTTAHVIAWLDSNAADEMTTLSHDLPGYPYAPEDWGGEHGPDNCADVSFDPGISVQPTTDAADSPTGLAAYLSMPQRGFSNPAAIAESDLLRAAVKLPDGISLNPSAAQGLGACSTAQVGLLTPIGAAKPQFSPDPAHCPDAAKLGTLSITTPLLDHPVEGAAYLAAQGDNPFGSLLALYLIAEDPASGVILKLPGEIAASSQTGQLETVFDQNPQQPFEALHLELFGGPRAALRTPPTCGTYETRALLTPWSRPNDPVERRSSFQISSGPSGSPCPSGFDPHLRAGTQNPLAGATSPFFLRLSREDGTGQLAGLTAALPPGLSGYLRGIPYCPDAALAAISAEVGTGVAQEASPACPAASRVGTVTAGAGAGPTPFYTSAGRVYLAGPYKGAPLSLAVVTPAVAGPFDLGNVVVRNALRIDPETAQITAVSDPIPTILHGIGLDLRDVRVNLDRPDFTLNPTSCDETAIDAEINSAQGASARRSARFQVGGCDRLAFKPKLSFGLKGAIHRRAHPALTATLTARPGDANLSRAQVKLPPAAFLDNSHIATICTRVQFAAHACPAASVYGHATALTPLLDQPLSGPVYLRSSSHQLPDLVADLNGQIEVSLVGKTDSVKGALRNTFEAVPDAPVTKFTLTLFGGKRGLIELSSGFCAHPRATVRLDAHNGKTHDTTPVVASSCPEHRKGHR